MTEPRAGLLPLHALREALEAWRTDPSTASVAALRGALAVLVAAYDVRGVRVAMDASPLTALDVAAGILESGLEARTLPIGDAGDRTATLYVDGSAQNRDSLADALALALNAVWAKQEARFQAQQLAALDTAVRGIAGVMSVDAVLQLIVDQVRELVAAEYAALGIVGPFGNIEQFITSGLSAEGRARIGALPRGRGLLGLIIREDSSFLIDDIARDSRRHGFPANHPAMHSFLGAPVRTKGQTIGNLYLTNKRNASTFSPADLRLVEMFALHAGIAMDNARLLEQNQRLAVVDERERISRDLHDSIIQSLYAVSLSLEDLPDIAAQEPAEGSARADQAIDSIHGAIRDIRNFIFGLQPELLDDADLEAGIRSLASDFQAITPVDLQLHIADGVPDLPADLAAHLLAITREALSNVAKHSAATQAAVDLEAVGGALRLTISDDGHGFDPTLARPIAQRGLANLRSRAEAAGGSLSVTSAPDSGTRVVAEIPLSPD